MAFYPSLIKMFDCVQSNEWFKNGTTLINCVFLAHLEIYHDLTDPISRCYIR